MSIILLTFDNVNNIPSNPINMISYLLQAKQSLLKLCPLSSSSPLLKEREVVKIDALSTVCIIKLFISDKTILRKIDYTNK